MLFGECMQSVSWVLLSCCLFLMLWIQAKILTHQFTGRFDAFVDGEGKWVFSPWYSLFKAAVYCLLKKRDICVYSCLKSLVLETSVCLFWGWNAKGEVLKVSRTSQPLGFLNIPFVFPLCSLGRAFFPYIHLLANDEDPMENSCLHYWDSQGGTAEWRCVDLHFFLFSIWGKVILNQ